MHSTFDRFKTRKIQFHYGKKLSNTFSDNILEKEREDVVTPVKRNAKLK